MPRKCSHCEKKSHDIRRCYDYIEGEPSAAEKREKEAEEAKERERKEEEIKELKKDLHEKVEIIKKLENLNEAIENIIYIDFFEARQECDHVLDTKTTNKFSSVLSDGYENTKEKYKYIDQKNEIYDKITNQFLQEKFKHSNGRVNISDMITVMTTKYISELFPGNVKICRDFVAILQSFRADDGYIKE
jgi:hypothetical protein